MTDTLKDRLRHDFARLIEQAVQTRPRTYRDIIATPAPSPHAAGPLA